MSLAIALRSHMPPAGPVYRRHDPYTKDDERLPPRAYKFTVAGRTYLWEQAWPFVREAKRQDKSFAELLEAPQMTLTTYNRSVGTLLGIYRQLRPVA